MIKIEDLIVGNGAGAVKTTQDVIKACKSAATRITVGSATLDPRAGNIGDTYYFHPMDCWSLNTLGLPNVGMHEYDQLLPQMVQEAHNNGKELWFSVAGFSPEEYADMTRRAFMAGVDGVELNLSCPNVWGKNGRKAIPAFDAEMLKRIYGAVADALPSKSVGKYISAKASPTDEIEKIADFAEVTIASGLICEVMAGNTKAGQRRWRQDGKEALSFRTDEADPQVKHEGGLAGAALTTETPTHTKQLCDMLSPSIRIIALGGIFNGVHAFNNIEAGAKGFMCTTAYIEYGQGILSNILEGLSDLMSEAA